MSLVKNNNLSYDTGTTVARFPKGVNIAPLLGITPETVVAKYYLQLQNKAIGNVGGMQAELFSFGAGDSVFIKCEMSEYSGGPFFGSWTNEAGCRFAILKNDDRQYIQWFVDDFSEPVAEVPWTQGVHIIGWIGGETGSTKWCKPWYDGQIVSDTPCVITSGVPVLIGGIHMGQGQTPPCMYDPTTSGFGLRIYEVLYEGHDKVSHLYACTVSGNGPTWYTLFDTRNIYPRIKNTNDGDSSYKTPSSSVGDFPQEGYGVQLADLQFITGSPYDNIIAIICDDSGRVSAGFDPADRIATQDDSDSHNFAFRMANGVGTTVTNPMPLPPNYYVKRDSQGNYRQYIIGDLIAGRNPKWNIWNDGIKFGKHTRTLTQEGATSRYFMFNIFKDVNGNDVSEVLAKFEGYNTAANHAPHITSPATMDVEFHNSISCLCVDSNKIVGDRYECRTFYKYGINTLFSGNINIGNFAPWNMSRAELAQSGLQFYGAAVIIDYRNESDLVNLATSKVYGRDIDPNDTDYFCSATSAAIRNVFRDGNIMTQLATLNDDTLSVLYKLTLDYDNQPSWDGKIPCRSQLGLIGDGDSIVRTSNVLPAKEISVVPTLDINHKNAYSSQGSYHNKDRFVIGENGGTCQFGGNTYDINVMSSSQNVNVWQDFPLHYHFLDDAAPSLGRGIGCSVGLTAGTGNPINIEDKIIAFMEVVMIQDDVNRTFYGRYCAFTMPETLSVNITYAPIQQSLPYWEEPYSLDSATELFGLWDSRYNPRSYRLWPANKYVNASDFTTTRSCIWRWKDLMHDTSSAENPISERPKVNGLSIPMTAHMRIFENTSTNKGPVAWGMYHIPGGSGNNYGWDPVYGTKFQRVTLNGTSYRFYAVTEDPILPYKVFNDKVLIVDCWLTMWTPNGANWKQVTSAATVPANFGFTLHETVLHTPHQRSTQRQYSTDPDVERVLRATFTLGTSTQPQTVGNYTAQISGRELYQKPVVLPNGDYGVNKDGFYRLQVWIDKNYYAPGSYYEINLTTQS